MLEVDIAIRKWARRDAEVATRLAKVARYRMDYLLQQMHALCTDPREAEARSLLAYAAVIGMHYAGLPLVGLEQERQDAIDLLTTSGTFSSPWRLSTTAN